jgi:PadR family transcriptional regulator AphA
MNRTEFAILGLLAERPRSGYDIKKEVAETLSHFWHESVGHIYPMLRRLREKGLVSRSTESTPGKPDRHVYAITEDGVAELRQWLAEPIEPAPPRLEILLKLLFGAQTTPAVLIEHVVKYRHSRERALVTLERAAELIAGRASKDVYLRLTMSAGIHAARAAIAWSDEALNALRQLGGANDATDGGGAPDLHDAVSRSTQ